MTAFNARQGLSVGSTPTLIIDTTGNVTAPGGAQFNGSGAGLSNTTVPLASLNASGTRDATTYLRGDGSWFSPSFQPLDGDLTAIAGLAGTSGFLKKTATDTWSLDTNTYINKAGDSGIAGSFTFDTSVERTLKASGTSINWGMYLSGTGCGFYDWQNSRGVLQYAPGVNQLTTGSNLYVNGNSYVNTSGVHWGNSPVMTKHAQLLAGASGMTKLYDLAALVENSSVVGTIKITFPVGFLNTMVAMEVTGYSYNSLGMWKLLAGGYGYNTGANWLNTSANASGNVPFSSVRFGIDGAGKLCILLGVTTTTWEYPQIHISEVTLGYQGISNNWTSGWTVTRITDETGIVVTSTPTLLTPHSRLQTPTSLTANLQTINSEGVYFAEALAACTNGPVASTAGTFFQLADAGGSDVKYQLFSNSTGTECYFQTVWGNTFRGWKKLWHDGNFDPTTKEAALGNPASNGYILSSTTAGVRSWIAPPTGIPTQTGNGGKVLTTDGNTASWGNRLGTTWTITATNTDAQTWALSRTTAGTLLAGGIATANGWTPTWSITDVGYAFFGGGIQCNSSINTNGGCFTIGDANGATEIWRRGIFHGDTTVEIAPRSGILALEDTDSLNAMLPTQTGNSGKLLTTDGTNTSWLQHQTTAGVTVAPSFTDLLNGSVTVGVGQYALYSATTAIGMPKNYSISGNTFVLTDGVINYVVADYNAGTPIIRVTTTVTDITTTTVIPIFTLYRSGTEVHYLTWDSLGNGMAEKIHNSIVKTQRFRYQSGLALGESGTRNVTIGSGTVFYGAVQQDLTSYTSASHAFRFYYKNAGAWTRTTVTSYNNTQYDNGTNLVTLSNNRYGVIFIYRAVEPANVAYALLGNGDFTLAQAQVAQPPSSLPPEVAAVGILVGRIIVLKNANTATQIDSAFVTQFTSSAGGYMANPMTTLGDTIYGDGQGTAARLAGPTTNGTYFLGSVVSAGTSVAPTWLNAASYALPDQAGNSGKVLSTNGSSASWSTPPAGTMDFGMSLAIKNNLFLI